MVSYILDINNKDANYLLLQLYHYMQNSKAY
nr:MAG TPA: hypothetical protein [Bacteriophage sp.]